MAHGTQPEPPFALDAAEMTRQPERSVRFHRVQAAMAILAITVLVGALAFMLTSTVYLAVTKSEDWHDMFGWWDARMALIAVLPAGLYVWRWNRIRAAWRFRGYHLGDEELYVRTGLMFRKFVVLAYARIQEVNVSSGPLQRRFRLATLTISSAAGKDTIEDIDPQTAQDLRNQLTEFARERRLPV
ncbi:PH domain-containing protein [Streptomyces sp. NPDC001073]